MSASLVGSEMCIRDRLPVGAVEHVEGHDRVGGEVRVETRQAQDLRVVLGGEEGPLTRMEVSNGVEE
eukprot:4704684-Alexandrium_andersonii.AAC.1